MVKLMCGLRTVLWMALVIGLSWFPVAWADLNDGLVAHYPFDGNGNDESGNGHDGTVNGATLTEDRFGSADSAYFFNGNGNNILVQDDPALNSIHLTISVWVKIASGATSTHMDIMSKDGECHDDRQYLITRSALGYFRPHVWGKGQIYYYYESQTSPIWEQWYHVVQTYDGNSLKIYVDGQPEGDMSVGGDVEITSQPIRIGGGATSGCSPYWFKGTIDDISIYNRALSECEIQSLYTGEDKCGVCVLDFADVEPPISYDGYPDYFNQDGFHVHTVKEAWEPVVIDRFLSCYERKSRQACEATVVTTKHIWYPVPDGQDAEVTSAHWFEEAESCAQLRKMGILPREVKLLATGVNLTATVNGSGIDLTLTTSAEPDTAVLTILRGEKLENGGTKIKVVCEFPSGGSPYTCTDDVVGDTYRVLETEYDGALIVYDEVTPK